MYISYNHAEGIYQSRHLWLTFTAFPPKQLQQKQVMCTQSKKHVDTFIHVEQHITIMKDLI